MPGLCEELLASEALNMAQIPDLDAARRICNRAIQRQCRAVRWF